LAEVRISAGGVGVVEGGIVEVIVESRRMLGKCGAEERGGNRPEFSPSIHRPDHT
jgi:hypothetical protein